MRMGVTWVHNFQCDVLLGQTTRLPADKAVFASKMRARVTAPACLVCSRRMFISQWFLDIEPPPLNQENTVADRAVKN